MCRMTKKNATSDSQTHKGCDKVVRSRVDPVRRMLSSIEVLSVLAPEDRTGMCDESTACMWF